jgi:hypothetical protein
MQTAPNQIDPENDLGTFNRLRRYLIRRWTAQIEKKALHPKTLSLEDGEINDDNKIKTGALVVAEGLADATDVLVIPATPAVEQAIDKPGTSQAPARGYFDVTTP